MRLLELTAEMEPDQYQWCYRKDGWCIRVIIHHLADSHMHAFLRLKWALADPATPIKAYDEAAWSTLPDVNQGPVAASLQLLDGLHSRWSILLEALTAHDWAKGYYHPETDRIISLQEHVQLYAWHSQHHYRHILLALDHEGHYKSTAE